MLTQKELDNVEGNFKAYSKDILVPWAYEGWHGVILELIEQARLAAAAVNPLDKEEA